VPFRRPDDKESLEHFRHYCQTFVSALCVISIDYWELTGRLLSACVKYIYIYITHVTYITCFVYWCLPILYAITCRSAHCQNVTGPRVIVYLYLFSDKPLRLYYINTRLRNLFWMRAVSRTRLSYTYDSSIILCSTRRYLNK